MLDPLTQIWVWILAQEALKYLFQRPNLQRVTITWQIKASRSPFCSPYTNHSSVITNGLGVPSVDN
jgi:hypothetical protein